MNWSPERKRLNRSIYFPLEIRMAKDAPDVNYSEFIGNWICLFEVVVLFNIFFISPKGIRIDFTLDPALGQADSIYIPMLHSNQMKKSYIHLQPKICSPIVLKARCVTLFV